MEPGDSLTAASSLPSCLQPGHPRPSTLASTSLSPQSVFCSGSFLPRRRESKLPASLLGYVATSSPSVRCPAETLVACARPGSAASSGCQCVSVCPLLHRDRAYCMPTLGRLGRTMWIARRDHLCCYDSHSGRGALRGKQ